MSRQDYKFAPDTDEMISNLLNELGEEKESILYRAGFYDGNERAVFQGILNKVRQLKRGNVEKLAHV